MATNKSGKEVENVPDSVAITQQVENLSISNVVADNSTKDKYCHQCRTKKALAAKCKAMKKDKPCPLMFCDKCLLNWYEMKVEEVETLEDWNCPKCRGICVCSACRRSAGLDPIGRRSKKAKNTPEKRVADSEEQNDNVGVAEGSGVGGEMRKFKKSKLDRSNVVTEEQQNTVALPVGSVLTNVAGVDLCKEVVANALQFSEFCATFREALDIQEGQAELVFRDIFHGQSVHTGEFSTNVQFHIQLLTILKDDEGEDYPEMTSSGENSWFNVLKESLSQGVLKTCGLDILYNLTDYESLDGSQKLKLLNILCDEVVETARIRNWIEDEYTRISERERQTKVELAAARREVKRLKQRKKDDIAAAINAKNGAALSTAEHADIVSRLNTETEAAHAEILRLEGILAEINQNSSVARSEPILRVGDYSYWKFNSDKTRVLCQHLWKDDESVGQSYDTLGFNEEWTVLDDEEKKVIEEHVCSLKTKSKTSKRSEAP